MSDKKKQTDYMFTSAIDQINKVNDKSGNGPKFIRSILEALYGKAICDSGKTKPSVNETYKPPNAQGGNYVAQLAAAKVLGKTYVNKLKGACGNQDSSRKDGGKYGSNSIRTDITYADVDSLKNKIIINLDGDVRDLATLETTIETLGLGDKTVKAEDIFDAQDTQYRVSKNFSQRITDLQLKYQQLRAEVMRIVALIGGVKGKDSSYLSDYYKTLLSLQIGLAGALGSNTRNSRFPTESESQKRYAALIKDLTVKLTTLKFDVEVAKKQKGKEGSVKGPITPFYVSFITTTDIKTTVNTYLTSTKPLYYVQMDTPSKFITGDKVLVISSKKIGTITEIITGNKYKVKYDDGTDSGDLEETNIDPADPTLPIGVYREFIKPETYRKIEAVNGFAFLQILREYKGMKENLTPEELFVLDNDICKYLFRVPEGKEFSYDEAIKNEQFQKQIKFLAIIHQMHFIGTLLKNQEEPVTAAVKESGESNSQATLTDTKAEKVKLEKEQQKLNKELEQYNKDLRTANEALKYINDTIKTIRPPGTPTAKETAAKANIEFLKKMRDIRIKNISDKKDEITKNKQKIEEQLLIVDKSDADKARAALAKISELETVFTDVLQPTLVELENILKDTETPELQAAIDDAIRKDFVFAYFENRTFAQTIVDEQNEKIANKEKELAELQTKIDAISTDIGELETKFDTNATQAKTYTPYEVPPFRGEEQKMFIDKYKYTSEFILSNISMGDTPPTKYITDEITSASINIVIQEIFRFLQDRTFSLQTLDKIKTELKSPVSILGAKGKTEIEAKIAPGTVGSMPTLSIDSDEYKTATKMAEGAFQDYENNLLATIFRTSLEFLELYQSSLIKEEKLDKLKLDNTFIGKIDMALLKAIRTLRNDGTKSSYEKKIIEEKYTRIRDFINEYLRLKKRL